MKKDTARASAAVSGLFGFTLFLSAAVMFALEPMVGKMLLPLVGGTPAGWIVALAFFQVMLLAGYLLAHLLSRLPPRGHGAAFVAILLAGAFFMPLSLSADGGTTPDAFGVFKLLTLHIGLPFVALATATSTLQRLFTVTPHGKAQDPYFLFAASNLGSFAGLLLYPLLAEPLMTLEAQGSALRLGYFGLVALGIFCLLPARGAEAKQPETQDKPPAPAQCLQWLLLALVPSSLLMGVTTYIMNDLFSAPLLWIVPLALYLLTFVAAFGNTRLSKPALYLMLHPYAACLGVFMISFLQFRSWAEAGASAVLCLGVFTLVCLACHSRLAALRPPSRHLTVFYLMVALGGALGGALNAFVIPAAFNRVVEFPLMLLASLLLHPDFRPKSFAGIAAIVLLAASVPLVNLAVPPFGVGETTYKFFLIAVTLTLACAVLAMGEKIGNLPSLLLGTTVLFFVAQFFLTDEGEKLRTRSFYGAIALVERQVPIADAPRTMRYLQHGNTVHGIQITDPGFETHLTSYYSDGGPLSEAFEAFQPKDVAVLGLGAGTIACYSAPGRMFTFVEIDPVVVKLAQEKFTFLKFCTGGGEKIVVGDGRLELEKMKDKKFDLIVVDVFSSDAIPVHMLTQEAFALYAERLTEDGIVAVNLSNRYLPLWETAAASAEAAGLEARVKPDNRELFVYEHSSLWAVFARKGDMPQGALVEGWIVHRPRRSDLPWTDGYSSIFNLLVSRLAGRGN